MVVHQVASELSSGARPRRTGRRGVDRRSDGPHLGRAGRPDRRQGDRRRDPGGLGRAGHRAWARQRLRPPAPVLGPAPDARSCAATSPRPPAGPSTPANQQVTVVDLHNLHERAQRFVVGVTSPPRPRRKEKAGPGGLLFTMIDELNKYAPREGQLADQGRAARHRRAWSVAGHHPDRRPADRLRGRAPDRVELLDQGRRPTRPGRGRSPRVRLPAAPRSGSGPPWRSRAPCSSPSRRSRSRWPSSSRSRPGRPGSVECATAARQPDPPAPVPDGRPRQTRSTGCPRRPTTTSTTPASIPTAAVLTSA